MNEDIIKGNKLIAEFDGWEKIRIDTDTTTNFQPVYVDGIKKGNTILRDHEIEIFLKYHSSWDRLMPVVYKCRFGTPFVSNDEFCSLDRMITTCLCNCAIYDLWLAVVEFITWYNNQK